MDSGGPATGDTPGGGDNDPMPIAIGFPIAFAALLAGAVAMGASPVFVRGADVGPFVSAFWRVVLALPVLMLWYWLESRRSGRKMRIRFSGPIVLAGFFFAGDLTFWHLAILNTTVANATLMACLAPFWVLMLSGLAIGERVAPRAFAGLAICLCGAAMLVGSSYAFDPQRLIGDFYGLVTSLFFGLYFLAVRVARRKAAGGEFIFLSTVVTTACLGAIALVGGGVLLPASASGYGSLAALGVVSHAGGQGLLALALGALSAGFSSLVIFVEALAAALLGWAILGEAMGPWQIAGAALILSGIWVARPKNGGVG